MGEKPTRRVVVQWSDTALECLRKLPPKVQRGLIEKADQLAECSNPRDVHKPLYGPLAGYYRITYARYRAVYQVSEHTLPDGDVVATYTVTFIACGKREEYSKDDVYRVAQKAVELGIVLPPESPPTPPTSRKRGRKR